MNTPTGHARFESITCPQCEETLTQQLDWNTSPPHRTEYAHAGHDLSDTCNVASVGRLRAAPEDPPVVLSVRNADGTFTDVDPDAALEAPEQPEKPEDAEQPEESEDLED